MEFNSGSKPADDHPGVEGIERLHDLKHDSAVLALAVNDEYIFAGTDDGEIVVWSLSTFQLAKRIQAHKRTILWLTIAAETPDSETTLLISSAADAIVSIWCPRTFRRLYEIYSTHHVGDIFSVAYSPQQETIYVGAQDTTIQWVGLKDLNRRVMHDSAQHPDRRYHRFFDSKDVGGTSTPRRWEEHWNLIPRSQVVLEIDEDVIWRYAHEGFVYCMKVAKGVSHKVEADDEVLITGGGEGKVKIWKLGDEDEDFDNEGPAPGLTQLMALGTVDFCPVWSLVIDGTFLYSGKGKGLIELWDLDTAQKLRVIKDHSGDVMTTQMAWGYLWSGSGDGYVTVCPCQTHRGQILANHSQKHNTAHYGGRGVASSQNVSQKYQCLTKWHAHNSKILASATTKNQSGHLLLTGAGRPDHLVSVWKVDVERESAEDDADISEDMMITSLREFVSYKTISSLPGFTEDCRRGASFLRTLFRRLGGKVEMLSAADETHNPVVYALFSGKLQPAEKRKRILFYGHYDVVPADLTKGKWHSDPFQLRGTSGYLYGRGVSDNKGPIVAALYAVNDLMQAKQLDSDVIFLIEGEEEAGSRSFQETVRRHQDVIGKIDYILLANSYWLDDETPCLTYGLRGVLHATVCVDSPQPDLHSGVDGSNMMSEPLSDLTRVLSQLHGPRNKVMIPGFYDGILPLKAEEEARYEAISNLLVRRTPERGPAGKLKANLMARWREPNLTIHRYKGSGADGSSLISSHASANISFRLVPGQEVDEIVEALRAFLQASFDELDSANSLSIRVDNMAEPWLGDPNNYIFKTLEKSIMQAWGNGNGLSSDGPAEDTKGVRKPMYIREGGSIPAIRFLEKQFGAPAAHLPCGQASDSAHLDNERLRVTNLLKSREIFGTVFRDL
jgi:di- and tripeptidase